MAVPHYAYLQSNMQGQKESSPSKVTFKNLTYAIVNSAKSPRLLAWRQQWLTWRYPTTARSCQNTRSRQSIGHSTLPTTPEHIRYIRLTLPRRSICPPAWTPHRKARSSNFFVRTRTYLRGVQPTCRCSQEIRRALSPIIPQLETSQAGNKTRIRIGRAHV